jgi:NDP-sugar pyrophosphorylase family protein
MDAVIIAGGFGTRLDSLTKDTPKPLVRINQDTIIEHQLKTLKKTGIHQFFITVHFLKDKIKQFCGTGEKWNIKITYVDEDMPQGTAGGLRHIHKHLSSEFFVLYGDYYLDFDIRAFIKNNDSYTN